MSDPKVTPSNSNEGVSLNWWTGAPTFISIASAYAVCGPLARMITTPGGPVDRHLIPLFRLSGTISEGKILPFASLIYAFAAYGVTPACSVVGVAIGNAHGYANKEPRHGKDHLVGLPYRMCASHQNLMEIFPLYALAAGLTAASTVGPVKGQALALLVLHVFAKTFVYVPAYLLDWDIVRSTAHFVGIGALLASLWNLTFA